MSGDNDIRKTGQVTGVSLGPGDPDLITVKALERLKRADKIYYPGSQSGSGKKDSYSLSILRHYGLEEERLIGFYLKMSLDREEAESLYEATFLKIVQDYENGQHIVIVSEGDLSTYSSFSYLLGRLKKVSVEVALVPGITSYAAAAAVHQVPLCVQNEKMVILPRVRDALELDRCIAHYETIVLMKIRSVMPLILKAVEDRGLAVFYGERLGTDREFTTTDLEEVRQRDIPYFSLMIVKRRT